MNRSKYQKYLASREWALLKESLRLRSKGKCERCLYGDYEATHHLTYERIGHEKGEDLLAVCHECHLFLSGKTNTDPRMTCLFGLAYHAAGLTISDFKTPHSLISAVLKEIRPQILNHAGHFEQKRIDRLFPCRKTGIGNGKTTLDAV